MIEPDAPGRYMVLAMYDDEGTARHAHLDLLHRGGYVFVEWRDTEWEPPEDEDAG